MISTPMVISASHPAEFPMGGVFQARRLVEEHRSPRVRASGHRREHRLPALEPEGLHAEQLLDLLHRVVSPRLALVDHLRRGR